MKSSLSTAFTVLATSSVAGLAMNLLRPTSMSWIRAEAPTTNTTSGIAVPPARTAQSNEANAQEPLLSAQNGAGQPNARGITAEMVLTHLTNGSAKFVDARETVEYTAGHLRGAAHIPASAIYQNIEKLVQLVPPGERIIIYCTGGNCEASHHVSEALQNDFSYQDVSIYSNGWEEIEKVERFKPFIAVGNEP